MATDLTVITNNQSRLLLNWNELTDKEKSEFDYLKTEDRQAEASFFRYRGWVYDVSEFTSTVNVGPLASWHGYASDTFFSGVCIRWLIEDGCYDYDRLIVGRYYS